MLSQLMLVPLFLHKLREKFPYLLVPKIKSYIEINKPQSSLKERGINSVYEDLYRAPFKKSFFDIIRLNWSLEHVHEPTRYLLRCRELLKESGILIITYKIFPKCVELPIHLYYFSVETFKRYAKKLDLVILDYYTFSYVPLFLTSLELSKRSDLLKSYQNDPVKSIALNTFFKTAKELDKGDDMVFCLSKEG